MHFESVVGRDNALLRDGVHVFEGRPPVRVVQAGAQSVRAFGVPHEVENVEVAAMFEVRRLCVCCVARHLPGVHLRVSYAAA